MSILSNISGRYFCVIYCMILSVLLTPQVLFAQVNNPVIVTCDGVQVLCANDPQIDVCVEIVVDENDPLADSIAYFQINWGDNSPLSIIPPDSIDQLIQHLYNLSSFSGSCLPSVPFVVLLETYYFNGTDSLGNPLVGGDPLNSGFVFTFRLPPTPSFGVSPYPCSGASVTFQGSITGEPDGSPPDCPPGGVVFEQWMINGDSSLMSNGNVLNYEFDSAGFYTIQYCVGNICDTNCIDQVVEILPPPNVVLEVDSTLFKIDSYAFKLCLYDSAAFTFLDLSNSLHQDSFEWEITGPQDGWALFFADSLQDSTKFQVYFYESGEYHLKVSGNNVCQTPDSAVIRVEIVQDPILTLEPQADTCGNLLFSPVPLQDSVQYLLNGLIRDSFPILLPLSDTAYHLEAILQSFCSEKILMDTFIIDTTRDVQIFMPSEDLTVCKSNDTIEIIATPGLDWSGGGGNLFSNENQVFFIPASTGDFMIIGSLAEGDCRKADTLFIRVEEPPSISIDTPETGCILLEYAPTPYFPEASYYLNGSQIDSFPLFLTEQSSPYVVSTSFENACGVFSDSTLVEVIIPEQVMIENTNDSVLCAGVFPVTLTANIGAGNWIGEQLTSLIDSASFNPSIPGLFEIIYERGEGLCRTADTISLKVVPSDSVMAGDDVLLCSTELAFQAVDLHDGLGYFSGFAMNNGIIDLPQLTVDSAYHYTYVHTQLPPACNTDTFALTLAAPPSPTFHFDRDTLCEGETVTITPDIIDGVNYLIDWGDGTLTIDALSHIFNEPGIWPVFYQIQTTNPLSGELLCEATSIDTVFVPIPYEEGDVLFSVYPEAGCAPLEVSIQNQTTGEILPMIWGVGTDTIHKGFNPNPILLLENGTQDTTQYEIFVVIEDGCGIIDYKKEIEVWPRPIAAMTATDSSICSGETVTFFNESIGFPTSLQLFSAEENINPFPIATNGSFSFFAESISDTIEVFLEASNVCGVDTTSLVVVVNPPDVAALAEVVSGVNLCVGDSFTAISQSSPGAQISWQFADSIFAGQDDLTIPDLPVGMYEVILYAAGCGYDSTIVEFEISPPPSVTVDFIPEVCPGDTVSFQVQTEAENVLFSTGINGFSAGIAHFQVYSQPGLYFPQAQVSTINGCKADWQGNLLVLQLPDALGKVSGGICAGDSALFEGFSSTPDATCRWIFNNNDVVTACSHQQIYDIPGTYFGLFEVSSPDGCVQHDSVALYVRPLPDATIKEELLYPCEPGSVFLLNESIQANGYSWYSNQSVISDQPTLVVENLLSGNTSFTLIADFDGFCFDTSIVQVSIMPPISYGLQLETHCYPEEGADLLITADSSVQITLSSPDYIKTGVSHPALQEGTYQLQITNAEGCQADTSLFILPAIELQLMVPEDSFFLTLGEQTVLATSVNRPNVLFDWTPTSFLEDPNQNAPLCTPEYSIQYLVEVEDERGCYQSDTVWVFVDFQKDVGIFIPNAFTPNRDGVNDIFFIRSNNPAVLSIDDFQVFDKYNEMVFDLYDLEESERAMPNNPYFGWNGEFRGHKAEAGAYRYNISVRYLNNEISYFSGTIELIR